MAATECAEVERFWSRCGQVAPSFPCDLGDLLPLHLNVTIITLPRLTAAAAGQWLAERGWPGMIQTAERPLHGCFVALAGVALIFVEATDPPNEQRFTLAHEAAHMLLDYLEPREDVAAFLGQERLAILDGIRPPSVTDRVSAVIANCPIGVYVQQLNYDSPRTSRSERRADRFARELLAPRALLTSVPTAELDITLVERFGLPPAQAEIYSHELRSERTPASSYLDWLRPSPRPAADSHE